MQLRERKEVKNNVPVLIWQGLIILKNCTVLNTLQYKKNVAIHTQVRVASQSRTEAAEGRI